MAGWEMPVGIVLTIVGGFALALQAGVNATLGSHITKPVSCELLRCGSALELCVPSDSSRAEGLFRGMPAACIVGMLVLVG